MKAPKANRSVRRAAERDEKKEALKSKDFKEAVRQTIRCKGPITSEELYKGMVNAIAAGHAELAVISEADSVNYFTNFDLMPIFNIISDAAEQAADEFNKHVSNEIAKRKDVN